MDVIENFMCEPFQEAYSPDKFIKSRISLIELAFRQREKEVRLANEQFPVAIRDAELREKQINTAFRTSMRQPRKLSNSLRYFNDNLNKDFNLCVDEINMRFCQVGISLNYHNGFVQLTLDHIIYDLMERPFWAVVSDGVWKNVDTDMKEALDSRDNGDRDPAFYSARALESAIKIISDLKNFTTGHENGAASYIQNLVSLKNGRFIKVWESEALIAFFNKIRNPLGHGPGAEEMPKLTAQQTNWAIESCMSWIKSLIKRM
jgi:hypothetical protein